jgi:hypothetical protein
MTSSLNADLQLRNDGRGRVRKEKLIFGEIREGTE